MKSRILFLLFSGLLFSCEEMPKEGIENVDSNSERVLVIDSNEQGYLTIENVSKKPLNVFNESISFGEVRINLQEKDNQLFINSNCEVVDDFSVKVDGEIDGFIETDVNADGYNEFYCVTKKGDIVAYASYRNKSFGEIYIPQKPLSFYKDFNELKFWEVKNNRLLLTFSNGAENQLNQVRYNLINGESGFKLIAE